MIVWRVIEFCCLSLTLSIACHFANYSNWFEPWFEVGQTLREITPSATRTEATQAPVTDGDTEPDRITTPSYLR